MKHRVSVEKIAVALILVTLGVVVALYISTYQNALYTCETVLKIQDSTKVSECKDKIKPLPFSRNN